MLLTPDLLGANGSEHVHLGGATSGQHRREDPREAREAREAREGHDHEKVDERHTERVAIPVLLGSGKRVFADATVPTALRLVESVTHPRGVLQLTYDTAGTPTYGRMGSPEPTSE